MFFVGARKEETRLILAPKKVKFINYEVDSFISRTNAKRFFPIFFSSPFPFPSRGHRMSFGFFSARIDISTHNHTFISKLLPLTFVCYHRKVSNR